MKISWIFCRGGLVGGADEEHQKGNMMGHFQVKKLENWEEQMLCSAGQQAPNNASVVDVKREQSSAGNNYHVYGHGSCDEFQAVAKSGLSNWPQNHPHQIMASSSSSSPKSCVTSFSSNMLDFSSKADQHQAARHSSAAPDRSSEVKIN